MRGGMLVVVEESVSEEKRWLDLKLRGGHCTTLLAKLLAKLRAMSPLVTVGSEVV